MKKILLLIFLALSLSLKSQVLITLLLGDKLNSDRLEFGLEGGINLAKISNLETNTYAYKWNLGFYLDINLKEQWFLYTGVLVKSNLGVNKLSETDLNMLGASIYTQDDLETKPLPGDYHQKMSYFLVPALAKYKFKNNMYIELGPQFGLMYQSWIEFNSNIEDYDIVIKEYNRDQINKIDAGLMIGAGYTLFRGSGWTFGAKYYHGLIDVYKDVSGTKNSSFFLKVNIPIGVGKKAKTDEG